jgi:lipopolysaccharide transport system ATP-binding protein
MSDIAIKFENISKQYRLGLVGTGTILHDINRWWYTVRGKEDPYLKIGEVNDRASRANSKYVWALKDITFEVKQGEVLGIIGKNGAGKSTLLKILSRVTSPTTGTIKAKGRIASLLEVGTGFHPELTGRENIFMNGSIMGMTKVEIRSKMDEIVDFAGVEKYIDTPVKRYSSGMTVRLGFAIAAHLEPEILVVDEVLAVGDAEFQKKAIGKMQDVSRSDGRTVLFVSHNMAAVQNLCARGVILADGQLFYDGDINSVIDKYLHMSNGLNFKSVEIDDKLSSSSKLAQFLSVEILNDHVYFNDDLIIGMKIKAKKRISDVVVGVGINTVTSVRLITVENLDNLISKMEPNEIIYTQVVIPKPSLSPGMYNMSVGMRQVTYEGSIEYLPDILSFEVEISPETINISNSPQLGTRPTSKWTYGR